MLDQTSLLLVAPFWPKRPWFPRLLSLLSGPPRSLPVFPGLLRQPISLIQHANPSTTSYSLAAFRSAGREAGLSVRAADLAAKCLRLSSRATYDSRLVTFYQWCHGLEADPYHASLTCVADFLISLCDRNKSVATIRLYRSAIASIHRGFADGSTVSTSVH